VPYALKNLRWLLHHVELPIELPTLLGAFQSMLASEKLQGLASEAENLVVRIFSFSFTAVCRGTRAGTAADLFLTAASLPNPAAKERFKALTGKDAPVIDYSESAGKRTPVSRQRDVVGGCQREQLPATRLQELDGVLRMHRRAASLGLSASS